MTAMTGRRLTKKNTLMTFCWCFMKRLDVPAEMVKRGETLSCGRIDCTADHPMAKAGSK